jgi:hypothetical protein
MSARRAAIGAIAAAAAFTMAAAPASGRVDRKAPSWGYLTVWFVAWMIPHL